MVSYVYMTPNFRVFDIESALQAWPMSWLPRIRSGLFHASQKQPRELAWLTNPSVTTPTLQVVVTATTMSTSSVQDADVPHVADNSIPGLLRH